jgi:hypothetical protein
MEAGKSDWSKKKSVVTIGLIASILGIVAWLTGKTSLPEWLGQPADDSSYGSRPTTAATPTTEPEPDTPPASPSPLLARSPSSAPSSPKPPPPPRQVLLASLEPVNTGSDVELGPAELGKRQHTRSVVHHCSGFCHESEGVIEYNLGGKYSWFQATVGVDNNAQDGQQVGTFEVWVDGERVGEPVTTRLGQPKQIRVSVADGFRLRLVSKRPDTESNPIQAGANAAAGVSNGLPHLAWGDPKLIP